MIVLGYNGFARSSELFASLYKRTGVDRNRVLGHDAAACVFIDGELVFAVEEERLSRVKKTSTFPGMAIAWCLDEAGLKPQDVDLFTFPWRFDDDVMQRLMQTICNRQVPTGVKFDELRKLELLYEAILAPSAIRQELSTALEIEVDESQLLLVPHHLAHLMCGHYISGGEDAAFLVSDGRAEYLSAVVGEINNGKIHVYEDMSIPIGDSISRLYNKVTRYLGFVPNNDEYKVMGLSAFGDARPLGTNAFMESGSVTLHEGGRYTIGISNELHDVQTYYELFNELFGLKEPPNELVDRVRVAAAVQDVVERVTSHQLHELERRTGKSRLLLEGGLALNCVNNGRISRQHGFSDVRVSFGASDPGVVIGAGYYPAFLAGNRRNGRPATACLGPAYDSKDILSELQRYYDQIKYRRLGPDELLDAVVELLCTPVVIGWFQGRTEYGPRALCNRSIIANPSFPGIQDVINQRVKKRETFRPFGPVIRAERAPEIFDLGGASTSPYMTFTYPVRDEFKDKVRGAVHVDGTSRIQTVTPAQNSIVAELLDRFERRTGVPALINTSFNVAGEPIVSSPGDALDCFLNTQIDYLVLDDHLVESVAPARQASGTAAGPDGG